MSPAKVALIRCEKYDRSLISESIQRQFDLLGGLDKFVSPGDKVLLKPNLIAPKPAQCATQTHPAVIIETAKLLKDFGAKPIVADSPAWTTAKICAKKLNMLEPLEELGVPVKQLGHPQNCKLADNTEVTISKSALDADVIINLPKFKSHQQLVATFAVKNMFGCVPGKRKALWHFQKGDNTKQFCEFLINLYKYIKPSLTIIDGIVAMDGPGPISGRGRPLGWLIASADPIACETICARLINDEPDNFPIIKTAKEMNFGCTDESMIEIEGDDYKDKICTDFEPAVLIPVKFTLGRVLKSICKQILLLLRLKKKK